MNGWERLGFVIATLIAIPSALIGYSENGRVSVSYSLADEQARLSGQEYVDTVYWAATKEHEELKGCVLPTARVETPTTYGDAYITCERTELARVKATFWYLALPYLVVWVMGLTVAWVREGFRNARKESQAQGIGEHS